MSGQGLFDAEGERPGRLPRLTFLLLFLLLFSPWWLKMVKNQPAMQETRVRPLSQEDALEKGMATYSSILARRIPWTEEPGGLQSMGLQSQTQLSNSQTHTHTHCGLY